MPVFPATESPTGVRPFLKWAGGKRQLLQQLRRFVPATFNAYHEPFLGSGAVFFDLWRTGGLRDHPCRLSDINGDLIGCYRALSQDVDGVVRELRLLAAAHTRLREITYYRVRDERFNPRRRQLRFHGNQFPYPADLAAMFIYLNRTGFNGLFRLNGRGDFNVPIGRYEKPCICDEATLRTVAAVLNRFAIDVEHEPFSSVETRARAGDFIYFDPPYAPISATARFTSYTTGSFSDADQEWLQQLVVRLAAQGCHVVLSNSTAPLVRDLYSSREVREAGLRKHLVSARRAINSNAARRGDVQEYVISNVAPVPFRP
jgi:DNA adenine methylase